MTEITPPDTPEVGGSYERDVEHRLSTLEAHTQMEARLTKLETQVGVARWFVLAVITGLVFALAQFLIQKIFPSLNFL